MVEPTIIIKLEMSEEPLHCDNHEIASEKSPIPPIKTENEGEHSRIMQIEPLLVSPQQLTAIIPIQEENYQCYHCERPFKTKDVLKVHIMRSHIDKTLWSQECTICQRKFPIKSDLTRHMKMHSDLKPYQCSHCEKTFKRLEYQQKHFIKEHQPIKKYECNSCGTQFNKETSLEKHRLKTHNPGAFQCKICKQKFNKEEYLNRHLSLDLKKHHRKYHQCPKCEKTFQTRGNLGKHLTRIHSGKTTWKFECTQCQRKFPVKSDLERHLKIHSDDHHEVSRFDHFKCAFCDKNIKRKNNLRKHILRMHSDKTLWKYSCNLCHEKFPTSWELNYHTLQHSKNKPFGCSHCSKAFKGATSLKSHQIKHHSYA